MLILFLVQYNNFFNIYFVDYDKHLHLSPERIGAKRLVYWTLLWIKPWGLKSSANDNMNCPNYWSY